MGNLVKGDRVKVTIEAEVKFGSSFGVDLDVGNGIVTLREDTWGGIEFEKIEPPVEVFKPGDVIRFKSDPNLVIALSLDGGYTYVGRTNRGIHARPGGHDRTADSRLWERVDL